MKTLISTISVNVINRIRAMTSVMPDIVSRILIPKGGLKEVVRPKVIKVVIPATVPQGRVL
jgi:hypothetical protein